MFAHLPRVTRLNVGGNPLTSVPMDALATVQELRVAATRLTDMPKIGRNLR